MAVQYDPSVIYKFAERLYSRAATIAILYGILGLFIGAMAGGGAASAMEATGAGAIVGALVGAGLGVAIGIEKGFTLRLQAQQALCQVKIEECVRYTASAQGWAAQQQQPAGYGAPNPAMAGYAPR
jgi:hypothetical protein